MIEKYLIRFCASEVQILITRLHERPEDFGYGNKWRDLVQARDGFTWAERMVLDAEWSKFKKGEKRRKLLGLITKQVLDPEPKNSWGIFSHSNFTHPLQNIGGGGGGGGASNTVMFGLTDPRSIYNQGNNNV